MLPCFVTSDDFIGNNVFSCYLYVTCNQNGFWILVLLDLLKNFPDKALKVVATTGLEPVTPAL